MLVGKPCKYTKTNGQEKENYILFVKGKLKPVKACGSGRMLDLVISLQIILEEIATHDVAKKPPNLARLL